MQWYLYDANKKMLPDIYMKQECKKTLYRSSWLLKWLAVSAFWIKSIIINSVVLILIKIFLNKEWKIVA